MKLAICGDVEEGKEGAALRILDSFVEDNKGGGGVVICAGSMRLLSLTNKYTREKGIPVVLLQSKYELAVLNSDKVLIFNTKAYDMSDIVEVCKTHNRPRMEIK